MPFKALLEKLVSSVEGGRGAIFLDSNGEAVQWWTEDDGDRLQLRAAYIAVVFEASRATARRLQKENVSQLMIAYDGAQFVVEQIEQDYLIILELGLDANLGQAILHMQPVVESLRREIAA